jgi:hypothetical protein
MRFSYDSRQRPLLKVSLTGPGDAVDSLALVDSGADVNVLPWGLGVRLGFAWNPNKATLRVLGAVDRAAAMPVLVRMNFGDFPPVTQAFAWCQSEDVPLVLGQTNFFMEFDICFFRTQLEFSVVRKPAL